MNLGHNNSTLFRSGKEDESDSWLPIQNWVLSLRSLGKSVLLIHHAGKSCKQWGTSRLEDVLYTLITMKRATVYKARDGACIEVYFEKNRALYGVDVKPFMARLESNTTNDGIKTLSWTCKSLEDSTFDTVCALANDGLGNSEIAQELEIHKSSVSRYVKRGKEEGIIKPLNS